MSEWLPGRVLSSRGQQTAGEVWEPQTGGDKTTAANWRNLFTTDEHTPTQPSTFITEQVSLADRQIEKRQTWHDIISIEREREKKKDRQTKMELIQCYL